MRTFSFIVYIDVGVLKKEKMQWACKPGYVRSGGDSFARLSFIYAGAHTPAPAAYPPASGEPPSSAGVFGIATHKMY